MSEEISPVNSPPPVPPDLSSDDKIWVIFCHLSLLLGVGFLLPLIVYLVKKSDAPMTAEHAKEALNFHFSVYLYGFVSVLLCAVFIGFLLLPAVMILAVVCAIIASVKAANGELYRYPVTIRLVS